MLDPTQTAAKLTTIATLVGEIEDLIEAYTASETKRADEMVIADKFRAIAHHVSCLKGSWSAP